MPKCKYPGCGGNYIPARTGKIELCPKHAEMLQFVLWVMNNVRPSKANVRGSGLVLPGVKDVLALRHDLPGTGKKAG